MDIARLIPQRHIQHLGYYEFRSEKVISGISHVLSRLPWYNILPKLLDGEGEGTAQGRLLRGRIRELYKAILFYQVRIVCSQRNEDSQISLAKAKQGLPFDNADLSVTEVVNAEKALECFLGVCIESQMRIFTHSHSGQRDATAVNHTQKGSPMVNDETRVDMLLGELSAVDRQLHHHRGLRSVRTKALIPLYEQLYQRISSLPEYKSFEANEVYMLWIIGTLGTGKSICLSAIMWAHSRQQNKTFSPLLLSFSRNGNGQQKPENAASAIKSLIYAILKEQSCLVDLLVDGLKHIGRGHLSHANDFHALLLILKRVVQDKRFQPTLILIDGVDEIRGGGTEFNRFLKFMKTAMSISSNVKWLISADTLPLSDELSMGLCIHLDQNHFGNVAIFNAYYIPFKVGELAQYGSYNEHLQLQLTELLRRLSLGNFFWADVVCQFIIQTESWHAQQILQGLLDYRKSLNSKVSPYSFMMDNINQLPFGDNNYCLRILGAMAEAYYPINVAELRVLVNLPPEVNIQRLITNRCFSFLELCCGSVCFTHRSARDFYVNHVNESSAQRHRWIVKNCLLFLSELLNLPAGDELHEQRATNLTTTTYYPIVCWIQHLVHVISDKEIMGQAMDVMTAKLLKWTDMLVSLGGLSRAFCLLLDLEAHLKVRFSHHVLTLVANLLAERIGRQNNS